MHLQKTLIRKQYAAVRQKISAIERDLAAKQAARLFINHPIMTASLHIACYHATPDEFDTTPIIQAIFAAKKYCYLPILETNKDLHFIRYQENDPLRQNHYAIFEPDTAQPPIAMQDLDLVICPLLSFDAQGNRLGNGGGYYDRTFAYRNNTITIQDKKNRPDHETPAPYKKPYLLGLAYVVQESTSPLPTDAWDIRLDGVLTEQRWHSL